MILPVTLTGAGIAALINLWLAMRCGQARTKEKILVGDGGNEALIRRMRAHSNFTEFAPLFLIVLGLIELATGTGIILWVVMALFMIGRVCHGFGMDGWTPGRVVGTSIAFLSLFGLGLYAIAIPHISSGQIEPAAEVVPTE